MSTNNAAKQESLRVLTPVFRLSYPHLKEPFAFPEEKAKGQEPSIRIAMMFPKASFKDDMKEVGAAINRAKAKKWGNDPKKWPAELKSPFRDGDPKPDEITGEKKPAKEGQEGMVIAQAKRKASWLERQHVQVRGMKNEILRDSAGNCPLGASAIEKELYAGCYCQALIDVFPYSVSGSNGVSFGLVAIRKVREGDPLGNSDTTSADDVWGAGQDSSLTGGDRSVLGDDTGLISGDDIPF